MAFDWFIEAQRPWLLAALPLALLPLLAQLRAGGSLPGMLRGGLRSLAVGLGIAALAGLVLVDPAGQKPWLLLRDVSGSTRGQRTWPAVPSEIALTRMDFARGLGPPDQAQLGEDRTRIGPALAWAAARKDAAGLIVSTDGRFTDDDWQVQARRWAQTGREAWIVPLAGPPADARCSELALRRVGDGRAEAEVTIRANYTGRATLTLRAGKGDLLRRTIEVLADAPVSLRVKLDAPPGKALMAEARIDAGDRFGENDRCAAALAPEQRRVVLLGTGEAPAWLSEVPVDVAVSAEFPPQGLDDFAGAVLLDASGRKLGPTAREALRDFVIAGGGLVVLGAGPHARPADADDPLSAVAPLAVRPWRREPLSVVVALDASGSMGRQIRTALGRRDKFRSAADAVLSLADHLTDRDRLTVLAFADQARSIYDSGDGPTRWPRLADALAKVDPDGATDAGAALRAAADIPVGRREQLVLLVSDLQTKPFDVSGLAPSFGEDSRRRLAIAAIGAGDPTEGSVDLRALADRADGWFTALSGVEGLEAVFADFLARRRGDATLDGPRRLRWVGQPPWGLEGAEPGEIHSVLAAAAKGEAEVLARAGESDLMGRWSRGLGRVVMLAADLETPANRGLTADPALAELIGRAVEWSLPAQPVSDVVGRVQRDGETLSVHISRDDIEPGPARALEARVAPVGQGAAGPVRLWLRPVAPGQWRGQVASHKLAGVALGLEVSDSRGRLLWRDQAPATAPAEFARIGPDWERLRRLARLCGGRIVEPWELADVLEPRAGLRRRMLWPWLVIMALALMLADWAVDALARRRA